MLFLGKKHQYAPVVFALFGNEKHIHAFDYFDLKYYALGRRTCPKMVDYKKSGSIDEFLNKLPEEMVELALKGAQLEEQLAAAENEEERQKIQKLLDENKEEMKLAAAHHAKNKNTQN